MAFHKVNGKKRLAKGEQAAQAAQHRHGYRPEELPAVCPSGLELGPGKKAARKLIKNFQRIFLNKIKKKRQTKDGEKNE